MMQPVRVALLDPDASVRRAFVRASALRRGIDATAVQTEARLRAHLAWFDADVVVTEFDLGQGRTSAELIRDLRSSGTPVLLFTSNAQRAIEAVGLNVPVFQKSPAVVDELFAEIERHRSRTRGTGGLRVERRGSSV